MFFVIFEGLEIGKLIHNLHPLNKFCLYFTLFDGFRQEERQNFQIFYDMRKTGKLGVS